MVGAGNTQSATGVIGQQVSMASIPSVDKSLGRASSWMSYAAFAGIIVLAFLPARDAPGGPPAAEKPRSAAVAPQAQKPAPSVAAAPAAVPPAAPTNSNVSAATPSSPAAGAPVVPNPDVWTPDQLTEGLRSCLQLLAPAGAEIALEEPMKRGQCGTPVPVVLRSIGRAEKVEFSPPPTMNCKLAASLSEWIDKVLQPAAQQALGSRIKKIVGTSSYSCRNIYNNPKLTLSEHATGNAIDIAGFITADGRAISVAKAWGPTERDIVAAKKKAADKVAGKAGEKDKAAGPAPASEASPSIEVAGKKAEAKEKGRVVKTTFKREDGKSPAVKPDAKIQPGPVVASNTKEADFLKRLHGGSCTVFATVLGPEANEAHRDHFHLDMKVRSSGATVCH